MAKMAYSKCVGLEQVRKRSDHYQMLRQKYQLEKRITKKEKDLMDLKEKLSVLLLKVHEIKQEVNYSISNGQKNGNEPEASCQHIDIKNKDESEEQHLLS